MKEQPLKEGKYWIFGSEARTDLLFIIMKEWKENQGANDNDAFKKRKRSSLRTSKRKHANETEKG